MLWTYCNYDVLTQKSFSVSPPNFISCSSTSVCNSYIFLKKNLWESTTTSTSCLRLSDMTSFVSWTCTRQAWNQILQNMIYTCTHVEMVDKTVSHSFTLSQCFYNFYSMTTKNCLLFLNIIQSQSKILKKFLTLLTTTVCNSCYLIVEWKEIPRITHYPQWAYKRAEGVLRDGNNTQLQRTDEF